MGIRTIGPTVIETAADGPEELGFLSHIQADPLDETPQLIYADWLEERGDPRGAYLRTCVELARDPAAKLPPGDEFPFSWQQAVGVRMRRLIRETLTGEDAPRIETILMRSLKPCLHMVPVPTPDDELPAGCTKFGGCPDLPVGTPWPMTLRGGQPFVSVFCAQIRLSDLRGTLVGLGLPVEGLLSFFAAYEGIVNVNSESGAFHRATPPAADREFPRDEFFPLPSAVLRLIEGADVRVRFDDEWYQSLSQDKWEELSDLDLAHFPPGIPFAPRHQLLGNGEEFNIEPLSANAPGMRRLASFGSDGSAGFYWGDHASPIFYIAEADLARGRFEEARSHMG